MAIIANDEALLRHPLGQAPAEVWPELRSSVTGRAVVWKRCGIQRQADVAFLDIRMPELDGISLVKATQQKLKIRRH
ncbi:hypothetical protein O9992_22860 [Vibrio lentus]|nr:hypothetical protein [Vibrio lentus]